MQLGRLQIEISVDGENDPKSVEIDLHPNRFTMREAVRFERASGISATQLMDRPIDPETGEPVELEVTFVLLQALVWTKLATLMPGLGIDDFDFDLGSLANFVPDAPPPVDVGNVEKQLFNGATEAEAPAVPKV